MRFDVLTLFPDMFPPVLSDSIIGRAQEKGLLELNFINIRDYTLDKHGRVDDYPYGGGKGMLMQAEPVIRAYRAITDGLDYRPVCIYMSPQGQVFRQETAKRIAKDFSHVILLCGHYEGIDERALEEIVDFELSIGDYVLTGGELAVSVICDAIIRLIPGVISDETSALSDSFQDNLLAPPVYTRPAEYKGWKVPEILLSGHEAKIRQWEFEQSMERTKRLRPDLLK